MSLDIKIETIPHENQRYETVGDWRTPEEGFSFDTITVSDMNNSDYEFCVAVHELAEMYLARKRGISASAVTEFDEEFERSRPLDDTSEPGDDINCPVYREHQFATIIEKLIAYELGMNWQDYEETINLL